MQEFNQEAKLEDKLEAKQQAKLEAKLGQNSYTIQTYWLCFNKYIGYLTY